MGINNKLKQIPGSWYFLIIMVFTYLILLTMEQNLFLSSIKFFYKIVLKMVPIFILVFILMTLSNYFITPNFIMKHLRERKIKKWFFIILGGILSSGPIYMWYPLLADLRTKGLDYGLIACFLYNRAIKIPMLPLMIFYFSLKYVIVLTIVMVFVSIIQGIMINKLMEIKK
jgi:uncharacterized membrane protein YraQ (UPF0718 family)